MIHSISNWSIQDPYPSKKLEEVVPISMRIQCLIARNTNHELLKENFISISGAINMISGLEYHYQNFMEIVKLLSKGKNYKRPYLEHEIIAYINRVGQFYFFATSSLVKKIIPSILTQIPTIEHIYMFRRKHTGHRSIDRPFKEDTRHLQGVHAMSLTGMIGIHFEPKDKSKSLPQPKLQGRNNWSKLMKDHWKLGYAGYQLNMGKDGIYNIFIEKDHSLIVNEAYSVFEKLFDLNTNYGNKLK
ncbi:MAG: hypothetical protein ABJK11_08000 [Balneola sp.]